MSNRKKSNASRREFLKYAGLTAMAVSIDLVPPIFQLPRNELIASANADSLDELTISGKNGLRVLSDRPLNAEAPPIFIG